MQIRLMLLVAVGIAAAQLALDGTLSATQLSADLGSSDTRAPRLDSLLSAIEPKMQALYNLCRIDAMCASRFYLSPSELAGNSAARRLQTADSGTDQKKFYRLLIFWAQQDDCPLRPNAVRGQLTLSDYSETDAAWWLTLMNTAQICGDNQVWETGQGCVIKPDRVDESGMPVRARSAMDSVGQPLVVAVVVVFAVLIVGTIVGGVYIVQHTFADVIKYVRSVDEMFDGKPPHHTSAMSAPPPYLGVQSAVDGDGESNGMHALSRAVHHHARH